MFDVVTENEICKLISSSKSTTCNSDPIPTKLLKQHLNTLVPLISKIITCSLQDGKFALQWKTAIIKPLLIKQGLELVMKNYRPVSNLSFLSKVTEKCCLNQFANFIEEHTLLPSYQSAYRKGFSTETALVKLCNDILCNMETQSITAVVAIDLSAAFDTVNHSVLLNVLTTNFAVTGKPLEWLDSYLRPRHAVVQIHDTQSQPAQLDFSVPQGSICGPVLYNVYASTLNQHIENFNISIMGYADDHSVYDSFHANSRDEENLTITNLENCLAEINDWMKKNRLKMNTEKTEFILFGNRVQINKCHTSSIKVTDSVVPKTQILKYLGVHLDDSLNLKKHIVEKCRIAARNIHFIKQVRCYLTIQSTQQLVQSLVVSHLDYANSLYVRLPACTTEPLQRIQNMAAKLVLNLRKYDSSTEAIYRLHWLPVVYRCKYKVACLVHRTISGNSPAYLQELLVEKPKPTRNLRSSCDDGFKLDVPYNKLRTFADRSFSVAAPEIWNELPINMRDQTDFNKFKSELKTYYFKKAYAKFIA